MRRIDAECVCEAFQRTGLDWRRRAEYDRFTVSGADGVEHEFLFTRLAGHWYMIHGSRAQRDATSRVWGMDCVDGMTVSRLAAVIGRRVTRT